MTGKSDNVEQMKLGLIGKKLGHSFSEKYFRDMFETLGISHIEYLNIELNSIDELNSVLDSMPNLMGFNVTIPYKVGVLPYLDRLSPEAEAAGAVNTVVLTKYGREGFNTDVHGFRITLEKVFGDRKVESALILGTGGASRAVSFVLNERGVPFKRVGRFGKGDLDYTLINASQMKDYQLLINTTPLGMWPVTDELPPIPMEGIHRSQVLIDLIYNPQKTLFLRLGEEKGCEVMNGLTMLHEQAEEAWKIWKRFLPIAV